MPCRYDHSTANVGSRRAGVCLEFRRSPEVVDGCHPYWKSVATISVAKVSKGRLTKFRASPAVSAEIPASTAIRSRGTDRSLLQPAAPCLVENGSRTILWARRFLQGSGTVQSLCSLGRETVASRWRSPHKEIERCCATGSRHRQPDDPSWLWGRPGWLRPRFDQLAQTRRMDLT
jgi:hypothetical protein